MGVREICNDKGMGRNSEISEKKFAIKMMKKSQIDAKMVYKILIDNEISLSRELNHPRIVQVFDLLED